MKLKQKRFDLNLLTYYFSIPSYVSSTNYEHISLSNLIKLCVFQDKLFSVK